MTTTTINYTGAPVLFVVPDQCTTIHVELYGAGGSPNSANGAGGRLIGDLAVTPNQVLHCYVGGRGRGVNAGATLGGDGGWNGGGDGGNSTGAGGYPGGGGGGGTDIRVGSTALSSRVCIAGGGGGASGARLHTGGQGGAATGDTGGQGGGANDGHGGGGGDQSNGGAHGSPGTGVGDTATPGALGVGGHGSNTTTANVRAGGGGGGGYHGGGGGGGGTNSGGGGGGGSNKVGTLTSVTSSQGLGSPAGTHGKIVLTYNVAPTAPDVGEPVAGRDVDKTIDVPVSWQFHDTDPNDDQSAADIQWRFGAGAWQGPVSLTQSAQSHLLTQAESGFSGHAGDTVELQVRTTDLAGAVGPWSTSRFFTLRTKPTTPTFNTPPALSSFSPLFDIVMPDGAVLYELVITGDTGGAPNMADLHGDVTVNVTGMPTTATRNVTGIGLANGTAYHLLARYQHYSGVWSDYVDSGPITCNVNPPYAPTLVLTPDSATASILVAVTNPGSDPHPPDYNIIYRQNLTDGTDEIPIATDVAINGSYVDLAPAAWSTIRYRAVAVIAATNARGSSA